MGLGVSLGSGLSNITSAAINAWSGNQIAKKNASSAKQVTAQEIAWERERAQNAHQWEVADLEKAGLNPILSAGGSGAITGGITGHVADYSPAANSAMAASQQIGETLKNAVTLQNETNKTNAEVSNLDADTGVKNEKAKTIVPMAESAIQTNNTIQRLNSAKQATEGAQQENLLKHAQLMEAQRTLEENRKNIPQAEYNKLQWEIAQLMENLDISRSNNTVQMYQNDMEINYLQSKTGRFLRYLNKGTQDTSGAVKGAVGAYVGYKGLNSAKAIGKAIENSHGNF